MSDFSGYLWTFNAVFSFSLLMWQLSVYKDSAEYGSRSLLFGLNLAQAGMFVLSAIMTIKYWTQ